MKYPLSTLVAEAFPADGEASAARLQAAIETKQKGSPKMKRRRIVALCAVALLVSASAVTAKVMLQRHFIYQNGESIGTMTTDESNGRIELNLTRDPAGAPIELRTESGESVGQAVFVPALSAAGGTDGSRPKVKAAERK